MSEITLYTHERPGAGLTSTNVKSIKGAAELRIVTEGHAMKISLGWGNQAVTTMPDPHLHPSSGKADLRLKLADQSEVNLAKCRWAVALVVSLSDHTVYWLQEGRCTEIQERVASPRSEIEGRHTPRFAELPPEIGCKTV